MGLFLGAERKFWQLGDGIWITAVGYAGGHTPNPTYEEVCSGMTGHTGGRARRLRSGEDFPCAALKTFWENHDPRPRACGRATISAPNIDPAIFAASDAI